MHLPILINYLCTRMQFLNVKSGRLLSEKRIVMGTVPRCGLEMVSFKSSVDVLSLIVVVVIVVVVG